MNEHITKNGRVLYYKLDYDLGGYSHATSREHPRGYYLSVQRQKSSFMAFQGLEHPSGAVRIFLHEVKRKSKKQEDVAQQMIPEQLRIIEERYDL